MAVETLASTSVKDYLRRYETKSKQSKKKNKKTQPCALGFLVVDDDPVWQKPINLREEYEDDLAADNKRKISEIADMADISVPRRVRHFSPYQYVLGASPEADLSPLTKNRKNSRTPGSLNASSQHSFRYSMEKGASRVSKDELLRSQKGQEKPKVPVMLGFASSTCHILNRVLPVKDNLLFCNCFSLFQHVAFGSFICMKHNKVLGLYYSLSLNFVRLELKSKYSFTAFLVRRRKLEWGKGLAQKRDAETRQRELEFEKNRPFAWTRCSCFFYSVAKGPIFASYLLGNVICTSRSSS
ncbi:hypothetical protein L1049_027154 [Liquidambar formosana]|uniref:Uncharacterized protein n=1 Tax=Liquidambar formosana TaxID=63359 RepID=A0AAP0R392_LIQFO